MLAGSLFLAVGLARIVTASQAPAARGLLTATGILSVLLGLVVLFNLWTAAPSLLGVLLGVQILIEGVTVAVAGRWRPGPAAL